MYLAHICAEALPTSLLARVCTSPRKRGEGAASRVGKGALLRAVPTNCDLWWARGACHRAGRRPDPLALPTYDSHIRQHLAQLAGNSFSSSLKSSSLVTFFSTTSASSTMKSTTFSSKIGARTVARAL